MDPAARRSAAALLPSFPAPGVTPGQDPVEQRQAAGWGFVGLPVGIAAFIARFYVADFTVDSAANDNDLDEFAIPGLSPERNFSIWFGTSKTATGTTQGLSFGFGVCNGTDEWMIAVGAEDEADPSNGASNGTFTASIAAYNDGAGFRYGVSFVPDATYTTLGPIDGGYRGRYTVAAGTASYFSGFMVAIDDLHSDIDTLEGGIEDSVQVITCTDEDAVEFAPDAILFGLTTDITTDTFIAIGYARLNAAGEIEQRCINLSDAHNVSPSDVTLTTRTDACAYLYDPAAADVLIYAEVTAIEGNSFTVQFRGGDWTGGAGEKLRYAALRSDSRKIWAGMFDGPTTAASDWENDDPAFELEALVTIQGANTNAGVVQNGASFAVGFHDNTRDSTLAIVSANNVTPTNVATTIYRGDKASFLTNSAQSATLFDIDHIQMTPTGFKADAADINTAAANSRPWLGIGFGAEGTQDSGRRPPFVYRRRQLRVRARKLGA